MKKKISLKLEGEGMEVHLHHSWQWLTLWQKKAKGKSYICRIEDINMDCKLMIAIDAGGWLEGDHFNTVS